MRRRDFVRGLAAAAVALPAAPEVVRATSHQLQALADDVARTASPAQLWPRVQREFQLHPDLIHLNCGSTGLTPRLVLDFVAGAMHQLEGNPYEGLWGGPGCLGAQMEQVRASAAAFLHADVDEVVLTRNTTEGMNMVATGLDLHPGDEVVTTDHEHGGGMVCWQHLARRGVRLVFVELPRVVTDPAQVLERVEAALTPRTKACSFSDIDTITGLRMPLPAIAELTRPRGILLIGDGAQVPGMLDVDVPALGVDAYASSSHKWMLAPKGSGLLYIRRQARERIRPIDLHSGPAAYSASSGTRNVPHILGHGVTMDFHRAIGRQRVEARCRQLRRDAEARLDELGGLERLSPRREDMLGGIVTYAVRGSASADVVARLRHEHGILVKAAQGTYAFVEQPGVRPRHDNALRFSTHIYNDEEQLQRTVDALRAILG